MMSSSTPDLLTTPVDMEASPCHAERKTPPRGPVGRTATIRLMTYNIQCGLNWPDVRRLILDQEVDVVCLQEVPQAGHSKRDLVRLPKVLDLLDWPYDLQMLWNHHPRRIGNLTLVRGRIRHGEVLRIAMTQAYGFTSHVEIDGARITVANLHLSPLIGPPPLAFAVTEVLRVRELLHLNRHFQSAGGALIAAGDFNTFWPAPGCWLMRRAWRDCRVEVGGAYEATRRTYGLPFVIDHCFVRAGIRPLGYEVVPGGGSDHRAVIATLEVPCEL